MTRKRAVAQTANCALISSHSLSLARRTRSLSAFLAAARLTWKGTSKQRGEQSLTGGIDYIYTSRDLAVESSSTVDGSSCGLGAAAWPSDHRAVLSTFSRLRCEVGETQVITRR